MIPPRRTLSLALALLPLVAGDGPVRAGERGEAVVRSRLCPDDAPPGLRLPDRPGCAAPEPRARGRDGFVDLGDGTSLRLSGRARGEYEFRH